jgi:enamine deaminase RidA (YjgF/YER057c/UK114 family)
MSPEEKLAELGIQLADVQIGDRPLIPWVRTGNLLYLSGKTPASGMTGQVGGDLSTEQGYEAARDCAIGQLAVAKTALGDLNKVVRVVKVLGMVNAVPGFTEQPQVINGFSDLMVEVFGEKGRHARSAVGMGSLPGNAAVEVEVIFEVE